MVSARARRLSVRVEAGRGVIVTVPKRFPKRDVPAFVEKHRRWAESVLADIDRKTPAHYRIWPPRVLELQAVGQSISLSYTAEQTNLVASGSPAISPLPQWVVDSVPTDKEAVATEIAVQLANRAREVFPDRLAEHAQRHGLHYRKLQIRGQRTVWGSYSSSGTLSLNYKLLFLQPEIVDYVMLHELAHTLYLDHSPTFWRHLETLHQKARVLDQQLSVAGRDVPPWLEWAR